MNKICSDCREEKPIDCFSTVRRNKDGKNHKCKDCYNSYIRNWSQKNKESVNARVLVYHHKNKTAKNLKRKKSYILNKDSQYRTGKEWAAKNPEKTRTYKRNYSHRRRQILVGQTWQIKDRELAEIKSQTCFYCGSSNQITIDHILPVSKGGEHRIGNLVPACKSCNSSKGNKFLVEWKVFQSNKEKVRNGF